MYKDPLGSKPKSNDGKKEKIRDITAGGSILVRTPFVSIVTPAKNDPVMIVETVRSCLNSTYTNLELILVNDGSTDSTGIIMDKLRHEYPDKVRVIHLVNNIGKRKAVREGIVQGPARGDLIMLIDSDCMLERTAIERMVRLFDNPEVGAASGHCRAANVNANALSKMQETWYDGQCSVVKAMESAFGSVTCCPGVLAAYRREAILPALDRWANDYFLGAAFSMGDDRHMTSFALGGNKHYVNKELKAWKVVYCESALVLTEVPTTLRKFLLQQIRWKKSWVRVFLFTAPFFYKGQHPFATFNYYLRMIWPMLTPLVTFWSLVILPLQGNYLTSVVYLTGLSLIGILFGAEYKLRHPNSGFLWAYRVLWGVISPFFGILNYYAILTLKDRSWKTR
jgi:cellulose synthase/poly-beta-1,6-N-acetylglucosamine synthase-like glycosyltransferase